MIKTEVLDKIENTIQLLYRNEEKKGLEEVEYLLDVFEEVLRVEKYGLIEKQDIIRWLPELLLAYQQKNVLAMADCLSENALTFIEKYF